MMKKELHPDTKNFNLEGVSCIYALCDPITKEAKYIGSTVNLRRRMIAHLHKKSQWRNPEFQDWVEGLKEKGLEPFPLILKRCDKIFFCEYERFYLKTFIDDGQVLNRGLLGLQHRDIDVNNIKLTMLEKKITMYDIVDGTKLRWSSIHEYLKGSYVSLPAEKGKLIQDFVLNYVPKNETATV